jgi:hypothetical protein
MLVLLLPVTFLADFAMEDLAWLGMAGMQRDFRHRILGLKVGPVHRCMAWSSQPPSHIAYARPLPDTSMNARG